MNGHIGTETRPRLLREAAVGDIAQFFRDEKMTVPKEEATANYVPAAAVIRRWQALSGITGCKGSVGGETS